MKNIYDYTLEELQAYFVEKNEKPFRATQVFEWLYRFRINNFSEMTNISKSTIKLLEEEFALSSLELVTKQVSKDGTIL